MALRLQLKRSMRRQLEQMTGENGVIFRDQLGDCRNQKVFDVSHPIPKDREADEPASFVNREIFLRDMNSIMRFPLAMRECYEKGSRKVEEESRINHQSHLNAPKSIFLGKCWR